MVLKKVQSLQISKFEKLWIPKSLHCAVSDPECAWFGRGRTLVIEFQIRHLTGPLSILRGSMAIGHPDTVTPWRSFVWQISPARGPRRPVRSGAFVRSGGPVHALRLSSRAESSDPSHTCRPCPPAPEVAPRASCRLRTGPSRSWRASTLQWTLALNTTVDMASPPLKAEG